jgi:hypothetical protein
MNNGYDDIVIQNPTSGQLLYADMTTGTFQGWVGIGTAPGYTVHTNPANIGDGPPSVTSMLEPGPGSAGGVLSASAADVSMLNPGLGSAGGVLGPVIMVDPGPGSASAGDGKPIMVPSSLLIQSIASFGASPPGEVPPTAIAIHSDGSALQNIFASGIRHLG